METISVSKFRTTCFAVVRRVKRTRRPVLLTRFGEPIAEVVPFGHRARGRAWLGCMQGSVEALRDEVSPALAATHWNALRQ